MAQDVVSGQIFCALARGPRHAGAELDAGLDEWAYRAGGARGDCGFDLSVSAHVELARQSIRCSQRQNRSHLPFLDPVQGAGRVNSLDTAD